MLLLVLVLSTLTLCDLALGAESNVRRLPKVPIKNKKLSCSCHCPRLRDPVCGFSPSVGCKTFINPCELKSANCQGQDYTLQYAGRCGIPHKPESRLGTHC
uniref:Kazal-like domain-containing protein n=1 Tax=Graphocephala atropunctata TaxID=36148 RepID=A0A1B6MQP8_9HEMI